MPKKPAWPKTKLKRIYTIILKILRKVGMKAPWKVLSFSGLRVVAPSLLFETQFVVLCDSSVVVSICALELVLFLMRWDDE